MDGWSGRLQTRLKFFWGVFRHLSAESIEKPLLFKHRITPPKKVTEIPSKLTTTQQRVWNFEKIWFLWALHRKASTTMMLTMVWENSAHSLFWPKWFLWNIADCWQWVESVLHRGSPLQNALKPLSTSWCPITNASQKSQIRSKYFIFLFQKWGNLDLFWQ